MSEAECIRCFYRDYVGKCTLGLDKEENNEFLLDALSLSITEPSSLAPYVPTPCRVIHRMLSLAELKSGEVVYDLGSGDGRIAMLAAGNFGAKAVGFEQEDDLVKKTEDMIQKFNLGKKVTIVKDNLLNAELDKADVVTMYLSPRGNKEIRPKLERELKSGTRITSLEFEIPVWSIYKVDKIVDNKLTYTIYVYKR